MEKVLQNEVVDKPEIQDALFTRFEAAPDHFPTEKYVDRLLEKSNNRIPDNLIKSKKIQDQRLQKKIDWFINTIGIKDQSNMCTEWDNKCAEHYGCSWNQLTQTQLSDAIQNKLESLYSDSQDKVGFLDMNWIIASNADKSNYGIALKNAVIEIVGREYDTLWKQDAMDPSGQETAVLRNKLDNIVDNSDDQDLKAKCRNTGAGQARIFLNKVHELNNNGLQPTEAGKMLLEYKKRNYTDYIRINQNFFKSENMDNKSSLIKSLFQSLSIKHEMESDYWEDVLCEYGFQLTQSWKETHLFRMLNVLSFITSSLEQMSAPELLTDLKDFCQRHGYRDRLWNKAINEQYFRGNGQNVLTGSLCKWLEI